ncbi:hypothetical protein MXL15_25945, partial [Pseudomonas mosselii]|nr:hypothetical protein [Pseudomonas mosselii]
AIHDEVIHEHIRSVWHDRRSSACRCPEENQDHQTKRESWLPPLDLTLAEWEEAVQRNVEAIMAGEKVKQLSVLYDTPQHAQQ